MHEASAGIEPSKALQFSYSRRKRRSNQARCSVSERDRLALTFGKTTAMSVTAVARQLDSFGKVHADFFYRVGIRGKSDRHIDLASHSDDLRAGIDFFAVLAQTDGVQFHRDATAFCRLQKTAE